MIALKERRRYLADVIAGGAWVESEQLARTLRELADVKAEIFEQGQRDALAFRTKWFAPMSH